MRITKGLEAFIGFVDVGKFEAKSITVSYCDYGRPGHSKPSFHRFDSTEQRDQIFELLGFALNQYNEHYSKPFVWGGVSPSTLEEQSNDPFQTQIPRYKKQPKGSWREGLPMEPGFDCVGFLRWVYGNQGYELFQDKKMRADEYREGLDTAANQFGLNNILDAAQPGDILFKCDPKTSKATHGMIYLGAGLILECAGNKEPDYNNVPAEEWERWRALTKGRMNSDKEEVTDIDRGGLKISHISEYSNYKIARAPLDRLKR